MTVHGRKESIEKKLFGSLEWPLRIKAVIPSRSNLTLFVRFRYKPAFLTTLLGNCSMRRLKAPTFGALPSVRRIAASMQSYCDEAMSHPVSLSPGQSAQHSIDYACTVFGLERHTGHNLSPSRQLLLHCSTTAHPCAYRYELW